MRKLTSSIAAALVLGASGLALAATEATPPKALKMLEVVGGKIVKSFPVGDGLTGWVVKTPQKDMILYSTATGKYLISGEIFSEEGQPMGKDFAEKYLPKPDLSKAIAKLPESSYVVEGKPGGKRVVYVFAEPNCGFCNKLWKDYTAEGVLGDVEIRNIPVAFLRKDSTTKAAKILSADNPTEAFNWNERHHGQPMPEDMGKADAEHIAKVQQNNALMREMGFRGTPAIVYQDDKGSWKILKGYPGKAAVEKIFGGK